MLAWEILKGNTSDDLSENTAARTMLAFSVVRKYNKTDQMSKQKQSQKRSEEKSLHWL